MAKKIKIKTNTWLQITRGVFTFSFFDLICRSRKIHAKQFKKYTYIASSFHYRCTYIRRLCCIGMYLHHTYSRIYTDILAESRTCYRERSPRERKEREGGHGGVGWGGVGWKGGLVDRIVLEGKQRITWKKARFSKGVVTVNVLA